MELKAPIYFKKEIEKQAFNGLYINGKKLQNIVKYGVSSPKSTKIK